MTSGPLVTRVHASIEEIDPASWDACFRGDPEGWAFYRAVEDAGPPGFSWFYITVGQGPTIRAAAVGFITDYRLDTTLQGPLRRVTDAIGRLAPGLLSLHMASLGSPVAEKCHLGFSEDVLAADRPALLTAMHDAFAGYATAQGCGLRSVKDVADTDRSLWESVLGPLRYQRLPGLPTGILNLPAGGLDAYLATLGRATRKDMKRKLRVRYDLRIEWRQCVDDVAADIFALYRETVDHSELNFGDLPEDYFPSVLRHLGPNASIVLYWAGEKLVAFNLLLKAHDRLVDKYIGMHYDVVRKYNLYFLSWFVNIERCNALGLPRYQSGQASYGPKLRLGCRLSPNWMYFRHRNPLTNRLLRMIAGLIRLDRFDPEITNLIEGAS